MANKHLPVEVQVVQVRLRMDTKRFIFQEREQSSEKTRPILSFKWMCSKNVLDRW